MQRSAHLFKQAKQLIPGGVNSPVRAFHGVGGDPVFFKKGQGPYLIDEDDKQYVDYVGAWGPMILGHAHPAVIKAVQQAADNGLVFGAPSALETELAKAICSHMPAIEKIRMVNSGTEATMTAIRLARGVTGRDKIIKFTGCYHGHVDSLLVNAGSGALTLGQPSSPGVPAALAELTLSLPYNQIEPVEQAFAECGNDIAAIIVEPIAGNMNCVPATTDFLTTLRTLCDQHQSILIFDEVMTGFRVALGGAQSLYDIPPDLTTLGKVIGGGMPVGAVGGKQSIMDSLAPDGPVYQAGTLSGHPVAMAAGLATLNELTSNLYQSLEECSQQLVQGITECTQRHSIPMAYNISGGMFGLFFTEQTPITEYQQVMDCDVERFKKFFHGMLKAGIYLAPSPFEAGFVSGAHDSATITQTIEKADSVLQGLRKS